MKKILCVVLSVIMMMPFALLTTANTSGSPELYGFYQDKMLFKQNEEAVLAGTGTPGTAVKCELINSTGDTVSAGESVIKSDGTFTVSFQAPAGGYSEYSIVLYANEVEFRTLENVVFGELWIASGQSNMQFPVGQSADYKKNEDEKMQWLRVLVVPGAPEYNGSVDNCPLEPQNDIPGTKWYTGLDNGIIGSSAVGFFFGEQLMYDLDMPVGIMSIALGGSSIMTWISRESIDSDEAVYKDMTAAGEYIKKSDWKESKQSDYRDMTANFNKKVYALRNFNVSGMVWYQGENEKMFGWEYGRYSRAFDLMQRSYTELFGYNNGLLPIVYTQIAGYDYGKKYGTLADYNNEFTDIQAQRPESRAMITIYDVSLHYTSLTGVIHPDTKQPVGRKMAFAAEGLVYGMTDSYTAPTVASTKTADGGIYVTLKNTGDGLVSVGNKLYGFAVCGIDGIYTEASAEIVSKDTVFVKSELVPEPVSASYAYALANTRSNLFMSIDGEAKLGVAPFVTDRSVSHHYYSDNGWSDCDASTCWRFTTNENAGYHNTWSAKNADITFNGENITVTSDSKNFTIAPVLTYKNGSKTVSFPDIDTDWSDYGKIGISVKNDSGNDVTLKNIRIYVNGVSYYTPAVAEDGSTKAVIPADGEWHKIEFDLNELYLQGNEYGAVFSKRSLDKVVNVDFEFENKNGNSVVSVDDITFTPDSSRSKLIVLKIKDIVEKLLALFERLFGYFK